MKSIVREDTEENGQEYVTKLMRESGAIERDARPNLEEIVRFDKSRKDKKVANDEWTSPTGRFCTACPDCCKSDLGAF